MLPEPCSNSDKEAYESILSVPWLKSSIYPTGSKWGRRIADVTLSRLPQNLLGQVMIIPSIPEDPNSAPLQDEVILVIFRCDRYHHQGWSKTFPVVLTFPDGSFYEVEVPSSLRLPDRHSLHVAINPTATLVREKKLQEDRLIPRIIFNLSPPIHKQASYEIRKLLKNIRKISDLIHCASLYFIIEDEACDREVENSGIEGFADAYNSLIPGAYKADLMRYYLLYKYGGIYLDNKSCLRQSTDSRPFDDILGNFIHPSDAFVSYRGNAEIAFMASRRGSPVMYKALITSINNIRERFYGKNSLSITGNFMFNNILKGDQENLTFGSSLMGEKWISCAGEKIALLPMGKSFDYIPYMEDILWYRQAIPYVDWPKPKTYYGALWNDRKVYTDRNGKHDTLRVPGAMELLSPINICVMFAFILICVGFLITRYPPISWI